ncbi:YsnF/AvaK domain-containing protein [Bacillus infantis]|uniref:YsnF/AvaK domain-containing protein n=1 Tax=Bacillus infantis TaxID=324767 RepID=UPI00101C9DB6|nr:YsnF/AvaK domain-containing protein [Bacillus infantis]RYI26480.1 YsnF/AvaK domain-containing protein [Bacillus infantis]
MMNDNKKFIGVFDTQEEAIKKIDDLKLQGYGESDIYAVAKDADDISMVRGRTGAEVEGTDADGGSWLDKFMSFLTGEDEVRGGMQNMGLTDAEADRYYSDIQAGKILLYVDKDYDQYYGDRTLANEANPTSPAAPTLDATGYGAVTGPNSTAGTAGMANTAGMRTGRLTDEPDGYVEGVKADELTGSADVEGVKADKLNGYAHEDDLTDEQRLRLREERLQVDKERVQTGEVHVEKDVVEEERSVDVNVSHDEVYVERRKVDGQAVDGDAGPIVDDNDDIRIPITEERLEVTKKPVVTEELVVGKRKVEDTETVRDTVKLEKAHVDGADDYDENDRDSGTAYLGSDQDDSLADRMDDRGRF